jgi:hypothetical protein
LAYSSAQGGGASANRLRSIIISDPIAFLGWEYATDCARGINRVSDQYRDPFILLILKRPLIAF